MSEKGRGGITTGLIFECTHYGEGGSFETYGIEMPKDKNGRYLVEYYIVSGRESCICYGERVYLTAQETSLDNRELIRIYEKRAHKRIDVRGLTKERTAYRMTAP